MGIEIATVFGQEKEGFVGDHVFLLQGSNVPVVLQLFISELEDEGGTGASSSSAENPSAVSRYLFFGTAYVHGIMDSEACPYDDMFRTLALGQYAK